MSSFHAVFQERNRIYIPLAVSYSLNQHTDHKGRPSSKVRVGLIRVYLDVADEDRNLIDWSIDPFQRRSGWFLFSNGEGRKIRQIEYRDAYLVKYYVDFEHGRTDWPSHVLVLELSTGALVIDSIEVEAHSTLPGQNSRVIRSRARTKAPNPIPTPGLKAQSPVVHTPNLTSTIPSTNQIPIHQLLPGECMVGTFKDLDELRVVGDDITPHHLPSNAYMKLHGISRGDGISIHMEQPKTGGRHRKTKTFGWNMTKAERAAYYQMSPNDALMYDIADARKIYQDQGLLTPHVEDALQEVIRQNKAAHPHLFS